MSSMTYWNVAETVRDGLNEIAADGVEMFSCLESNDSPGEVAEALADIEKQLTKLAGQISPNVVALRKVAKALDEVPGVSAK
jgi:hypothetical protein